MPHPVYYEQGRVLGGGSSVNGQVALRGAPEDYDHWNAIGAKGWDWNSVLPYFRRLETDLDYTDQLHGAQGPITVRRMPMEQWDDFTLSVTKVWNELGYPLRPDMNGAFGEGYSPLPLSNDGTARRSTAVGYLDAATRRRPNLQILGETQVRRILFARRPRQWRRGAAQRRHRDDHRRQRCRLRRRAAHAVAADAVGHRPRRTSAPARHRVQLDRPGVGSNLMDHPAIHISGYLQPVARHKMVLRRNYTYLRWSSGLPDVPEADMVMMAVCRSAWHAIGVRIGTLSSYIGRSYSTGEVRLASPDPDDEPDVNFNWLSDQRDLDRMVDAFRRMARILTSDPVPQLHVQPVRLEILPAGAQRQPEELQECRADQCRGDDDGFVGDSAELPVRQRHQRFASAARTARRSRGVGAACARQRAVRLACLLHLPDGRSGGSATPSWIRGGKVVGADNLFVADASVMPEVSRTNTNIPTIMIAERIAERCVRR